MKSHTSPESSRDDSDRDPTSGSPRNAQATAVIESAGSGGENRVQTGFEDAPSCHCESHGNSPATDGAPVIALVGAPNAGKSTLFNALTGSKAKMGNWPGTTVATSRGVWKAPDNAGREAAIYDVIDFPGAYSLDPISPDEALTRELLLERDLDQRPDLVVVAVDASTLSRGLYLASQLAEHPYRVVVVLTKLDVARQQGFELDPKALGRSLNLPVVAIDPRRREISELAATVERELQASPTVKRPVKAETLGDEFALSDDRFTWIDSAVARATVSNQERTTVSEKIDRWVLNPVLGPLIFLAAMWCVFQITTTVAAPLQDALDTFFTGPVSDAATSLLNAVGLRAAFVHGLIVDGLIGGLGMVLTFAPLMALMFLCLAVLEDSGYMARAAVVADRFMRAIGLPGKAFIPLIVGFGCNVPAISATRVLSSPRQRLMTALLVPFTSCSARLTVYVMIASTFFPRSSGTVVFAMYVISIVLVVITGFALKSTLWKTMGAEPLVIDLPVYQWPVPRLALSVMWMRLKGFLHTAGGIIVCTVIAVWLLQSTPVVGGHSWGDDELNPKDSAYGAVSETIAPVFEPAGFGSWSLTGPLITGFVAKEAVISSWAQTYSLEDPSDESASDQGNSPLASAIREDFTTTSGGHGLAAVWAFMIFLLAYTPCVATLAAQKREIGLKWTLIGIALQLTIAWTLAVITFQVLKAVL